MSFELKKYLSERRALVETYLTDYFNNYKDSAKLVEAMSYSLQAGGKRVRPILAMAAFEAAGGKELQTVLPLAAALECIHTYSLIHDDLPAMDDDDLRRGMPTNHKVFGEATAILAGDGLLTEAFAMLANKIDGLPADIQLAIAKQVADAAGGHGMVGGQLYDLEHEGKTPTLDSLRQIHTYKTGKLLTVAVEVGAMAAGRLGKELQPFTQFGYHLGYGFQIYDDVLDIIGGAAIGKTQQSDLKHEKATFVALMGVDKAKAAAEEQINLALAAIKFLDNQATPLIELAKYIVSRAN